MNDCELVLTYCFDSHSKRADLIIPIRALVILRTKTIFWQSLSQKVEFIFARLYL